MNTSQLRRDEVSFAPVTLAEWDDLQALFSQPGPQRGCWCMYWRVRRSDFHGQFGEPHREAMRAIVASGRVPGILAYHGGRPVGWCSVAAREEFPALDRSRSLRRIDDLPVWSIVCFFVTRPYRSRGLVGMLIQAAVTYATAQGAQIIEAYPVIAARGRVPHTDLYTGLRSTFERLGFREVAVRSTRRCIMRLALDASSGGADDDDDS